MLFFIHSKLERDLDSKIVLGYWLNLIERRVIDAHSPRRLSQ
jgi:hypothetical protein